MCIVKWDENYFEDSDLYVWVYRNGRLESTDERFRGMELKKVYTGNNILIKKTKQNERETK